MPHYSLAFVTNRFWNRDCTQSNPPLFISKHKVDDCILIKAIKPSILITTSRLFKRKLHRNSLCCIQTRHKKNPSILFVVYIINVLRFSVYVMYIASRIAFFLFLVFYEYIRAFSLSPVSRTSRLYTYDIHINVSILGWYCIRHFLGLICALYTVF